MNRTRVRPPTRTARNARKADASKDTPRVYKIGEAARMVGVEPFVLRFWETQFPFLRTRHEPSKHRVYGEREIAILNAIKRLLHKERFTIEGARKHIREHGLEAVLRGEDNATRAATNVPTSNDSESLRRMLSEIRRDLVALREKLLD